MDKITIICKCGTTVEDVYNPQRNFEYMGCDDENNPYFKCRDCGYSYGGNEVS